MGKRPVVISRRHPAKDWRVAASFHKGVVHAFDRRRKDGARSSCGRRVPKFEEELSFKFIEAMSES